MEDGAAAASGDSRPANDPTSPSSTVGGREGGTLRRADEPRPHADLSLETKLLAAACWLVLVQTHDGPASLAVMAAYAAALAATTAGVAVVMGR